LARRTALLAAPVSCDAPIMDARQQTASFNIKAINLTPIPIPMWERYHRLTILLLHDCVIVDA